MRTLDPESPRSNHQKLFVLKFNKNKFPLLINAVTNDQRTAGEEKKNLIRQQLKSWYQHSFQKNNRWNRTKLIKQTKDYSIPELNKLGACFELLFNTDNQYHQVFCRYLKAYQEEKEIAKSNLGTPRLNVNQNTLEEIIHYFGDLKRADQIKNTNKEIAKIVQLVFNPDIALEETTIIDRIRNKKEYK